MNAPVARPFMFPQFSPGESQLELARLTSSLSTPFCNTLKVAKVFLCEMPMGERPETIAEAIAIRTMTPLAA